MSYLVKNKFVNYIWKRTSKKGFFQNILIVLSGIIIARIIIFATAPFLTRLYDPKLFGKLGVVVSLSNILFSIASFKMELAFPLLTTEDKKDKLWQLCFKAVFFFMVLAICVLVIFQNILKVKYQLGLFELTAIVLIVGISGVSEMFKYYNISYKRYKVISLTEVLKATGQAFVPFIFAFSYLIKVGLIIAEFAGRLFGLVAYLWKDSSKLKFMFIKTYDKEFLKENSVIDYIKYSSPARLLNSVSIELVPVVMGYFYGLKFLGFFSLGQRMIALPVNLLGRSITDAFYGEASALYTNREYAKLRKLLTKIVLQLFSLSIIPSILFFFFSVKIFVVFFGSAWSESGVIVKLLIPFFTFQLAVAPVSQIFNVIEKQKLAFLWDLIRFIMSIILLCAFSSVFKNAHYSVLYFSISMSLVYIGFAVTSFFELKKLSYRL